MGRAMQWINSRDGYGWLSIILHWSAAIILITMLLIGFRADMLEDAGDRSGRAAVMGFHVGLGATLLLVLLARVLSSWLQPRPAPVPQPKPLMLIAVATHQLLLIAILIQIVSGPLAIWSGGRAINIFDVISIPSPFAERNQGVHEFAEVLHAIGRWSIIVLGRMLAPPERPSAPSL